MHCVTLYKSENLQDKILGIKFRDPTLTQNLKVFYTHTCLLITSQS